MTARVRACESAMTAGDTVCGTHRLSVFYWRGEESEAPDLCGWRVGRREPV